MAALATFASSPLAAPFEPGGSAGMGGIALLLLAVRKRDVGIAIEAGGVGDGVGAPVVLLRARESGSGAERGALPLLPLRGSGPWLLLLPELVRMALRSGGDSSGGGRALDGFPALSCR